VSSSKKERNLLRRRDDGLTTLGVGCNLREWNTKKKETEEKENEWMTSENKNEQKNPKKQKYTRVRK
jgi:hypothetical protein